LLIFFILNFNSKFSSFLSQISQETREKILQATDIVDLIGSYIPVKRSGSSFKANCPFHNEKSPSFHINAHRQNFKCFGCGEGGNAITFVMKYEGLSFGESIKKLAAKASIPIIEEAYDANAEKIRRSRGRLLDLHREAARFMHDLLLKDPAAKRARDYMKSRGYNSEMAKRWLIGWMPDSAKVFLDWARDRKFTGRELVDSGIAAQRDEGGIYLRFRDRLMFPINNEQCEVVAFSARKLREEQTGGKYINSPETTLFSKSKILFALDRARRPILQRKSVVICEGQLDVIALHEHGIDHAIGTQGTALTPLHAKILKRNTDHAVLCFDSDSAGYAASEKAFRQLAEVGVSVSALSLPPGDDPDSFLKEHGVAEFQKLLDQARPFLDYKIDRSQTEGGMANAQARANTAHEIADLLSHVNDAVTRDALMNHCSTRLQISPQEIRNATSSAKKKNQSFRNQPEKENATMSVIASNIDPTIAYLCHLALYSIEARNLLSSQFETLHEATQYFEGVSLLETILSSETDPSSNASINLFLSSLPQEEQLALENNEVFQQEASNQASELAELALSKLSEKMIYRRVTINQNALAQQNLSRDEMTQLLNESKDLSELLKSLGRRIVADDRAHLGVSKVKKIYQPKNQYKGDRSR
jgi:DNA primase